MAELRETSYLFSLRELERMEVERKQAEDLERVASVALRKQRMTELETERRAAEEEARRAKLKAELAEQHERDAHNARLQAVRESVVYKATVQAELTFQRTQLELLQQQELATLKSQSRRRLGVWQAVSALSSFAALVAIGAAVLVYQRAANEQSMLGAETERRAQALRLEKEALRVQLSRSGARVDTLARELTELRLRLSGSLEAEETRTPTSATGASGSRQPGRRLPPPAPTERPRKCKGDPNDPLNPCLPT